LEIRRLNSLRALAALIVLVGHYSNHARLWDAVLGTRAPQLGVMLFFLLSAFLMTILYIDRPPTAQAMRGYGVARVARVVPLFVAVVLASHVLGKLDIAWLQTSLYAIPDWKAVASHLLTLYGVQVLWTIPAELHFYAIFALLWWLRPRLPLVLPVFCIVVLGAFASGHWPLGPKQPFHGFPIDLPLLRGLPYFVSGMLLGLLYLRWQPPARWRHPAFVAGLGLVLLLYPAILERLTGWTYVMWFNPLVLLVMSLAFFCIVFMVPAGNRLLENRIGDHLGKISYSLYLLHFPILLALGKLGLVHGVGGLLLFLAITIASASLSFRLLEAPARKALRALTAGDEALAKAPTGNGGPA
jgi:peptidoglycan/LPS O-acetylase OafA/YrhL